MKAKDNLPSGQYVARDISWMYFNQRILLEAAKKTVPLMERLSFLGIYSNNLDEFFRVRVATLSRIIECEDKDIRKEKQEAERIFKEINKLNKAYTRQFEETFAEILKDLEAENIYVVNETQLIYVVNETQLTDEQRDYLRRFYLNHLNGSTFPLFLPQVKQLGELADADIYLAIRLTRLDEEGKARKREYAVIEMPVNEFGRFIRLPDTDGR